MPVQTLCLGPDNTPICERANLDFIYLTYGSPVSRPTTLNSIAKGELQYRLLGLSWSPLKAPEQQIHNYTSSQENKTMILTGDWVL